MNLSEAANNGLQIQSWSLELLGIKDKSVFKNFRESLSFKL
jgi:hypothetical protein